MERRQRRTPVYLRWEPAALERPGLFVWEAFVTGSAKGVDHSHGARIAAQTFLTALPDPTRLDVGGNPRVLYRQSSDT